MKLRFLNTTKLLTSLVGVLLLFLCMTVGCTTSEKVTGDQLLGPGNRYGVSWDGSQDEYEKVRQVKPKLVASTPTGKRKTAEQKFLDSLTQSNPQIEKAKQYFFEAESIYNDAVRLRQTANGSKTQMEQAGELFLQAGKRYHQAGEYWLDSALHEDSQFMAAECYFYVNYYKHANLLYKAMLKEYPNTRHLDRIQEKRFQIAKYWIEEDFNDKQGFFDFNFTDKSMPFNSRFSEAIAILDKLRHDDPTSDMADDATMLVADSYFKREQFERAHLALNDLVTVFPESEHQFIANYMMLQCKFLLYQGPDYSGVYLDEGEQQVLDIRRQFPVESQQYAGQLDKFARQFRYMQAERQWWVAQFYEGKEEYGAAKFYYQKVAQNFADTPFANRAFTRYNDLKGYPDRPESPAQWLVDLFPENDKVKPLIANELGGDLR